MEALTAPAATAPDPAPDPAPTPNSPSHGGSSGSSGSLPSDIGADGSIAGWGTPPAGETNCQYSNCKYKNGTIVQDNGSYYVAVRSQAFSDSDLAVNLEDSNLYQNAHGLIKLDFSQPLRSPTPENSGHWIPGLKYGDICKGADQRYYVFLGDNAEWAPYPSKGSGGQWQAIGYES